MKTNRNILPWLACALMLSACSVQAQPATRPAFAPAPKKIDVPAWPANSDITAALGRMQSNRRYHTVHGAKYFVKGTVILPAVDNVEICGDDNALICTLAPDSGTVIDGKAATRFAMHDFWWDIPSKGQAFDAGPLARFGPNHFSSMCQHWATATYPFGNGAVFDGLAGEKTYGQSVFNVGCDDCWVMNCDFPGTIGEDMLRWVRGNTVHAGMDDGHEGQRFHVWNNTFRGPNAGAKSACSARVGNYFWFEGNHLIGTYTREDEDDPGHTSLHNVVIRGNIFEYNTTTSFGYPIQQIDIKGKNDGIVINHNIFHTRQRQQPISAQGSIKEFKSVNGNVKISDDGFPSKALIFFAQSHLTSDGTNTVAK